MRASGLAALLLLLTGCASVASPAAARTPSTRAAQASSPASGPTPPSLSSRTPLASASPALSTGNAAPPSPSRPAPAASDAYPSVSAALAAGAVPWADLPYRSPVDPDPLAHPAGTPPWCTAADLTIAAPRGSDGAGGFLFFDYTINAKPGHRCSLQGYPVVHETDEHHTWSLTSEAPDTFAVPPGAVLSADHPGEAEVRWGHDASGYGIDVGRAPRIVTFDLPHAGGIVTLRDSSVGWYTPGQSVPSPPRHLGRLLVEPLHATGPVVYSGLRHASISARLVPLLATARAGATLHYQAWLSTGGPGAYDGPPCLGYRERLVEVRTGTVITSEYHALNCRGVASLPRSGRLFDLELRVPASVRPGDFELDWESDIGGDFAMGSVGVPVTVIADS